MIGIFLIQIIQDLMQQECEYKYGVTNVDLLH